LNFKFSKELVDYDFSGNPRLQLRLYKVYNEADNIVGSFHYYPKEQFFKFGEREISISVISKLFKKSKYLMLDKGNQEQAGEYEVFGGYGINRFYQDVPSSPTGIVKIADKHFNFRRIPAEVEYSVLKKATWGYFKFKIYSVKGNEFYEYSLKMDIPVWGKAHFTNYRPFIGNIESNSDNLFVLLAGFYLMEIEFDYEDSQNDG
jgi:hypothetical protein